MPWRTPKNSSNTDADPVGVVGGYKYPRGPVGATGYPGSNYQTAPTHSQAPEPVTLIGDQAAAMQSNPDEFYGGIVWEGPAAMLPVQSPRERRWYPRTSQNTTGTTQRNTSYFGGAQALPDGTDRYVYGGVRGYSFERPIPLTRDHLRRKAGAGGYDGSRYYAENQGQGALGAIGQSRSTLNNRPTVFDEPPPWSSNFYDTTQSTGDPGVAGNYSPPSQVYVSPNVRTNSNGGTWRRGG